MEKVTAFIDESGTNNLNIEKDGVSNLFICAATIIRNEDIPNASNAVTQIQNNFFSGSQIKSSNVGSNHKRREKILKALVEIPFLPYAVIIDKAQINRDSGLQFKPPFYKYINRMLYQKLQSNLTQLHIVADTIGGAEFMKSFDKYLSQKKGAVLPIFRESENLNCSHEFASPSDQNLLQISDFISGTLAYCFDPEKKCEKHSTLFLETLTQKNLVIDGWPLRYKNIDSLEKNTAEIDATIRAICENSCYRFIENFSTSSDELIQIQVATLRHLLLLDASEIEDDKARYAESLIFFLNNQGFDKVNKQNFGLSIIGPLRDSGILIAGDTHGYRLAMNLEDIHKYVHHNISIIEPMLNRLKTAQDRIKTGTSGQYDILNEPPFLTINDLVQTYGVSQIKHSIASSYKTAEENLENP